MADGITTNYGFTKPEKGASENSWGDKLNANWDKADLQIKANADAIGALDTSTTSALSGKQPLNANLTSIAALGSTSGRIAYTTGSNTWAEAEITSAGRALLDDADATAQRATLGLGSAALMDDSADSDLANDSGAAARRDIVKSHVADEIAATPRVGEGQTWQDVTGSRSAGVDYQNNTGRAIQVMIAYRAGGNIIGFQVSNNGSTWFDQITSRNGGISHVCPVIPNGGYYRVLGGATVDNWLELR